MTFLKLIRFPNLVMIALVQYLIRLTIIIPILEPYKQYPFISDINFFLLVFSTLLIAAGGYIINDYRDLVIDSINKPSKVIVGNHFEKRWCMNLYILFSSLGVLTGFYLSFVQNIPNVWMIHLLSACMLWLYSSGIKKLFFAGNLVISFLTALSILVILMTDTNALHENVIKKIILFYAVFAFTLTIIREIIKDMEDLEGDKTFGRKTLPVVLGSNTSKLIAAFFIFIVLFSLGYIQYLGRQWEDRISFLYVLLSIELPLIGLLLLLFRANRKEQFNRCSTIAKGIMLTGILSMLVFYLRYK